MAKRIILGGILIVFAVVIGLFAMQLGKHNRSTQTFNELPIVELMAPDSTLFYTSDIVNAGIPIVVNYFHPTCNFCESEILEFLQYPEKMQNAQWLFITTALSDEIIEFLKEYPIDELPNSMVLSDHDYQFIRTYLPKSAPTTYIYTPNGKLKKMFKGMVSLDTLEKAIRQAHE